MAAGLNPQGDWDRIYAELRRLAAFFLRRRAPHSSLQPAALVNEAWLRLASKSWRSRSHFMAAAASAMRKILVDSLRARLAEKRGGDAPRLSIEGPNEPSAKPFDPVQILAIHEALERLAQTDERKARIVEMRFFGGMDFEEIAEVLDVAPITVKRDWHISRAWLYAFLTA